MIKSLTNILPPKHPHRRDILKVFVTRVTLLNSHCPPIVRRDVKRPPRHRSFYVPPSPLPLLLSSFIFYFWLKPIFHTLSHSWLIVETPRQVSRQKSSRSEGVWMKYDATSRTFWCAISFQSKQFKLDKIGHDEILDPHCLLMTRRSTTQRFFKGAGQSEDIPQS